MNYMNRILQVVTEQARYTHNFTDLITFINSEIMARKEKKEILREMQVNLLNSSNLVVVGRKGCIACKEVKEAMKSGIYIESEIVKEYLIEILGDIVLPCIFLKGEFVADGVEMDKIRGMV